MAVSIKIWEMLEGADLDTRDLAEGRLELENLVAARSLLYRLVGIAVQTYNETVLSDEEQTILEKLRSDLEAFSDQLKAERTQAYIANVQKAGQIKPDDPDATIKFADLSSELAADLETLDRTYAEKAEETQKAKADLDGKRGSAALDRLLKELKGKRPDPPSNKPKPVFWQEKWAVLDLLKRDHSEYKGQFKLDGSTRDLYFYPTGRNWQTPTSYAKAGVWHKLGTLPEHADLSMPTHIPRLCHRVIYMAGEHSSLTDLFNAVCRTITDGSGLKGTPSYNAGGVVPLYLITDNTDLDWPRKISTAKWAEDYHWTEPKPDDPKPDDPKVDPKPKPKPKQ